MKLLFTLFLVLFSLGCGGYSSSSGMQPATTPNISSLSPNSTAAGSSEFMLTVNGTGFAGNSVVYWNSATVTTTFVNAQQVTASVQAADIATAGSAAVYVKNPGTGIYATGVNSNSVTFTIN